MVKLINDYLEYSKIFKRKGTYEYDKATASHLIRCLNDLKLSDFKRFDKKTIQDMAVWFKSQTACKNSKINAIISFMYKVLKYYDINTDLPKQYKLPNDTVHFKSLNDADLDRVFEYLKTSNNKHVLAVYVLLESGVRFTELVNIRYENIDFNTRCILLNHTKNGIKRIAHFGPLSEQFIKDIEHDYFTNITHSGLRHFLDKIKKDLSIDRLHPHMLRKTFATQLLKRGCPLTSIQKYLGHTDIKMTMIYLDIDIQMLDSDYNNYYPYK